MAERSTDRAVAVAPSVLREMNRRHLYRALFVEGPMTRPRLADRVGLSQPTVIAVLGDLERDGLVRVAGRPGSSGGRPAYLYEANPQAGAIAAVDIGREWVRVVVTDLVGTQLRRGDVKNTARSARGLVALTGRAVRAATRDAGLADDAITHTVIGSPGVFDSARGRVSLAANLPGWVDVDLASTIARELGDAVTVENDANLAAVGEHAAGVTRGVDDFVYLHIGTGVGMGLVLGGRVYRGASRSAGEVGYMPFLFGAGAGPHNLDRGALEEAIAADAVVAAARGAGMRGTVTAAKVFERAADGHPAAVAAVRAEAHNLAPLIATVASMLDPELIVFGGGVGQNLEALRPHLVESLAELTPLRPTLTTGTLGADAVLRGAVETGLTIARDRVLAGGGAAPSLDAATPRQGTSDDREHR